MKRHGRHNVMREEQCSKGHRVPRVQMCAMDVRRTADKNLSGMEDVEIGPSDGGHSPLMPVPRPGGTDISVIHIFSGFYIKNMAAQLLEIIDFSATLYLGTIFFSSSSTWPGATSS